MEEIWKDIAGYEGIYQVSNLGKIRSCERKIFYKKGSPRSSYKTEASKIMSQHLSSSGYYVVTFGSGGKHRTFSVHRIVAQAFILNQENKPQVNHIDGNRLNNCANNLKWATASENGLHAYKNGLSRRLKGELSPHKVAVLQFEKDGTFVKKWPCMVEAARALNGEKAGIHAVCCGRKHHKTYKGYIWKYAGS